MTDSGDEDDRPEALLAALRVWVSLALGWQFLVDGMTPETRAKAEALSDYLENGPNDQIPDELIAIQTLEAVTSGLWDLPAEHGVVGPGYARLDGMMRSFMPTVLDLLTADMAPDDKDEADALALFFKGGPTESIPDERAAVAAFERLILHIDVPDEPPDRLN